MSGVSDQQRNYENKPAYETDSCELSLALVTAGEIVLLAAWLVKAFAAEQIAGTINFPPREMSAELAGPQALVLSACDGIDCNASVKASLKMLKTGFLVCEGAGG